ncbi:MAG TPA: hypothetical protein VK498_05120 [Ferruginibacter sp.]|nr:hypothetical protein [Ferruginibacter sp.]
MEGVPQHLIDAIRKAIEQKETFTDYLEEDISDEMTALLKQYDLLVIEHPKDKTKYKIFIPPKFRMNWR